MFEAAVIPAKAGIYSANLWKCAVLGLDSSRNGGTGMTGGPSGSPFQMTPAPNPEFFIDKQASHFIIS